MRKEQHSAGERVVLKRPKGANATGQEDGPLEGTL